MQNSMAIARFFQLVSDFSITRKNYETAIRYEVKADEKRDLTLVSQRVYGNRNEFLTIMACARLSSVDEPLTEQLLTLPTSEQLRLLKKQAGLGR